MPFTVKQIDFSNKWGIFHGRGLVQTCDTKESALTILKIHTETGEAIICDTCKGTNKVIQLPAEIGEDLIPYSDKDNYSSFHVFPCPNCTDEGDRIFRGNKF